MKTKTLILTLTEPQEELIRNHLCNEWRPASAMGHATRLGVIYAIEKVGLVERRDKDATLPLRDRYEWRLTKNGAALKQAMRDIFENLSAEQKIAEIEADFVFLILQTTQFSYYHPILDCVPVKTNRVLSQEECTAMDDILELKRNWEKETKANDEFVRTLPNFSRSAIE